MKFYFVWTPDGLELEKKYLWEVFHCMDGILISRGYVTKKLEESIMRHGGIRNFLRWSGLIIGDSGAWLYKNDDEPPYSVKELLEYYVKLKIPVGAHLDHAIFKQLKLMGLREN